MSTKLPLKLNFYIIKKFFPPFIITSIFFLIIYVIVEFFDKMNYFIALNIPFKTIILYYLYYSPKIFYMLFPLSILFAVLFIISSMNQNNELLAIYSAGISNLQFTFLLIITVFILTFFIIITQDFYLPKLTKKRLKLEEIIFRKNITLDNVNISKRGLENNLIFVDIYNNSEKKIINVTIIYFNKNNDIEKQIKSSYAIYDENKQIWNFYNLYLFQFNEGKIISSYYPQKEIKLKENPEFFSRGITDIDTITLKEAIKNINYYRKFNIIDFENELKFWQKFSLPLGGFIISILAISIGTYLKRNVLIYSLLICLIIFGIFYWITNTFWNLGRRGFASAFIAAWIGDIIFLFINIITYKILKT
ncbi:MAG: LptF/LptG family permease [Spirochaetes bacterium]|nr:LptF/LptG family permease [Spirochaetota bacterium]